MSRFLQRNTFLLYVFQVLISTLNQNLNSSSPCVLLSSFFLFQFFVFFYSLERDNSFLQSKEHLDHPKNLFLVRSNATLTPAILIFGDVEGQKVWRCENTLRVRCFIHKVEQVWEELSQSFQYWALILKTEVCGRYFKDLKKRAEDFHNNNIFCCLAFAIAKY